MKKLFKLIKYYLGFPVVVKVGNTYRATLRSDILDRIYLDNPKGCYGRSGEYRFNILAESCIFHTPEAAQAELDARKIEAKKLKESKKVRVV